MTRRDTYDTPGRECAHARKGCCPKCFDPAGLLRSTREFLRRKWWRNTSRHLTTQKER